MAQGFIITEKGQKWIAQYAATKPSNIVITRVMVGSGELAEDDNPEQFDNLVQPVAQASSTIPMVKDNIISFIVEYRNDMNGGLKEGFWLREFGVFARDGEQEILLYYATLEAYPQYVDAYQNNKICVKKYPVSIAITGGIKDNTKVKLEYSPAAFVTEERMKEFTENETLPYLQEALKNSDSMIQKALESKADAETVAAQLATKADTQAVMTALSEKANSTDMTEELNKKANKNDMQIALAEKANAQEVQQALNQKADAETMTTELEKKANEIIMLEELAKKANKNDMITELAKKADKDDMQKELDQKANIVEVEELLGQTMDESSILMELDKKANKTDVQIELDKKADAEMVQEELGKKADTEVVQQELDKKADSETVSTALALKADSETMTTELAKKANSSHNHSASDINSGTLPIARGGTGNTTGNAATATKLQTARTIDGVNFDGSANIVHFGVCNTATNNSTKTVELPGFVLVEGARIAVYFANDGNAGEIGLNVNNTGLHLIVCRKGYIIASKSWESGQIVEFIYYSSQWIMLTTIACRLYTARTIQTNLASTSSASFDGTANVAPGVTGTLPIANGGTGATTAAAARNNLGLGNTSGAVPVANGGTGATTAANARNNLGAFPNTGGTISGNTTIQGNLTLKTASSNYGCKINFGDSDYVHLYEVSDDKLEIKASNIDFVVSGSITKNGAAFGGSVTKDAINNVMIGTGTGTNNVAVGDNTLSSNTTGSYNTSIGYNALQKNTTGNSNTAVGYNTLNNAIKEYNTAVGAFALENLTTGTHNTAIGLAALEYLTTGLRNVAIGYHALFSATNCSNNIAIGSEASKSNKGAENNVAIGTLALSNNELGIFNVALGNGALSSITGGTSNTALGYSALKNLTGSPSNCTGVGHNAQVTGSNQVQLGDTYVTVYAQKALVTRSDERDKIDIEDSPLGLNFIMKLRPVKYRMNSRENYFEEGKGRDFTATNDGSKAGKRPHYGLIAQEVKQSMNELGVDFAGYLDSKVDGGEDVLSLGYAEFIAPMIKAIQQQQQMIEQQQQKIEILEKIYEKNS